MAKDINQELMEHARKQAERPVHFYTLPDDIAKLSGIKELGFVELTGQEEVNAIRRARNDAVRLAFELSQESLRYADNVKLSTADGTADQVWEKLGPQGRNLALAVYGELHTPKEQTVSDFIRSRVVRAG